MTDPLTPDVLPKWHSLLEQLRLASAELENSTDWPADSMRRLEQAGVLRWMIPQEFGGIDASGTELLRGYVDLAAACLVSTFILTQRNAAAQRIVASTNESLRRELLPPLASGEQFATVGISHLTTSRQHLRRPAVTVRRDGADYVVAGEVPWVTGGRHADYIVTGGTCDDDQQVLLAVPTNAPGVACAEPVQMLALSASGTGRVILDNVRVPERLLIAGPAERVMQMGGSGGTGSLGTSALALGLSHRAVSVLESEAARRPDIEVIAVSLRGELATLLGDLNTSSAEASPSAGCSSEAIRQRANSLVLRATQAALTASKGAGFISGHPAERGVREAMFFLVWSCPQPVSAAALREFACLAE